MTVYEVDGNSFRGFVCGGQKVVIDAYTSQCHYCEMIKPILEKISNQMGNVRFGRVNIGNAMEVANNYGITGVPVLIYFSNGQYRGKTTGFLDEAGINAAIRQYLG